MTMRALVGLGLMMGVWALSLVAQAAPSQSGADATARAGTLSGAVVTKDGAAVRRATVDLQGPDGTRSSETDDEGRFRFADVAAGVYRLFASKAAWLSTENGATAIGGVGQPIEMANGGDVHATLVLARGAVLSGVIRDIVGEPIPDVIVTAWLGAVRHDVWTNDEGEYRIYGLVPGEYLISAVPQRGMANLIHPATVMTAAQVDAALAQLRTRQPSGNARSGAPATPTTSPSPAPAVSALRGFAPVFYPGTVSDELATKIPLSEGEEIDGLDIILSPIGTSLIRGTIVGLDRKVVNQVFITASHAGRSQTGVHPSVTAAGTFEIANLTPGRYTIDARQTLTSAPAAGASAGARSYASWGSTEVDVAPGASTDVTVVMEPPLTFSGRVVIDPADGGSRPLGPGVSLSLTRIESAPGEPPTAAAAVRGDGQFTLTGLAPGSYRLVPHVPTPRGPWRLKSVVVDGRERLDPVLEFDAASGKVQDAIVTVSARHTELSGTLTTTTRTAAAPYRIIAFSADPAMWRPGSRRLAMTTPDAAGHFTFSDLPPGDYLLAVLATFDAAWQTPEFLAGVAPSAVKVSLDEAAPAVRDLAIAAQPSVPR